MKTVPLCFVAHVFEITIIVDGRSVRRPSGPVLDVDYDAGRIQR